MTDIQLLSLSPLDGRYAKQTKVLRKYFSEFAIIQGRLRIEVEYLLKLGQTLNLDQFTESNKLRELYKDLTVEEALKVKEIEATTRHDVKAVEYYLRQNIANDQYRNYVHFALTSQDINTPVFILQVKDAWQDVLQVKFRDVFLELQVMGQRYLGRPMLSRTHGQPASPTTVGKELMVFCERIRNQLQMEKNTPWTTKFGGAVGNFNAHILAFPDVDWPTFANQLIEDLDLTRSQYTTQIDHYDHLAAHFDNYKRLNTILIDLCTDVWDYISRNYFKLKVVEGEVGSSAMPHKVNPIDFENAEAHFKLANSLFEFFSRKLPVSRLQRDLTDSATLRYVGEAFGMTLQGLCSLLRGLGKLDLNEDALDRDLRQNWVIISEGIQTVLKREGMEDAYEQIKTLTRKADLGEDDLVTLHKFINSLDVPQVKQQLLDLTPFNYLGMCDYS
jgi:adenylosuccinate lyase